HAKGAVGCLGSSEDRIAHSHQHPADKTVQESSTHECERVLDQHGQQVHGNQPQQEEVGGSSPVDVPNQKYNQECAAGCAVDIARTDQPRLLVAEAEPDLQPVYQCRHDVDVEESGGGEKCQQK